MLALISLLVIYQPTQAATLEVSVKHSYSENRTLLYQSKKKWYCDTELKKDFELKGESKSVALFPSIENKRKKECRSEVKAALKEEKKTRLWRGCSDDPEIRPMLEALSEECGR